MGEKLIKYKIVNIVIICLIIYVFLFPEITIFLEKILPNSTKCVYLTLTGKECPLCGGTRYIKNIKNVFNDINYLFCFFGIIVVGAIFELLYRIINLCNLNNKKFIEKSITFDILIHSIIIFLFFLYEIIYIIYN